jgi:type IV secretion system protein VirB6
MDIAGLLTSPLDYFRPSSDGFHSAVFYKLIIEYLDVEIVNAFNRLFSRTFQWMTGFALVLMTIWVWWQGWRIMTGQSQESMARFFATTAQRVFILGIAFGASIGSNNVFYWLGNELPKDINYIVTGSHSSPATGIDRNLAYMQVALSSIDMVQTGGDQAVQDAKTRSLWFAGIGTAGPAVVGGAMLLINKIAMGLFVGFGPLFVLMLIFDYTKPLFQKWLYYGIGTIFALVMLNLMIGICTEMIWRVSAALWMTDVVSGLMGNASEGITSRAMQQGGLGMILTMLIVATPPMAAAFFNGTMGQFSGFNLFQGGSVPAGARGPGTPPGVQQTVSNDRAAQTTSVGSDRPGAIVRPQESLGTQRVAGAQNETVASTSMGERGVAANNPPSNYLRAPSAPPTQSQSYTGAPASTPPQSSPPRGPGSTG